MFSRHFLFSVFNRTYLEQHEGQITKKHNTKKHVLQLVACYLNEAEKGIRKSYAVTNLTLITVILTMKNVDTRKHSRLQSRRQNKLHKNRADEK